jgi:hypothetical protein
MLKKIFHYFRYAYMNRKVFVFFASLFFCFTICIRPLTAQQLVWELVTDSAAFGPRDGAGAMVYQDRIWLVGGWNPDSTPNRCSEVWTSTDGRNWICVNNQAPWPGRHCMGTAVYQDKMWLIGGDGLTDVWNSSDGVHWNLITEDAPWGPRYKPYVMEFHDTLWLMGGFDVFTENRMAFNDVWCSVNGADWIRVLEHAPWEPRGVIHGKVIFNDRMWILGGGLYNLNGGLLETYYNDVWSSADGIHWQEELDCAPWKGRIHHSIEVFDDKMWLMAGHNKNYLSGPYNLRKDVWFSSDGVQWELMPDIPWAHTHAASIFVYDSALWLAAGYLRNEVWRMTYLPADLLATENKGVLLYPNPAQSIVYVDFLNTGDAEVFTDPVIYDAAGNEVSYALISNSGSGRLLADISDLPDGLYYIMSESQGRGSARKFVKLSK